MRYSDLSIRYNSQTGEPYIYADNTRYAGFFVRLAAYLLDRLIAAAVLTPVWLVLTLLRGSGQVLLFTWSLRAIVLYLLRAVYFVLFLKLRGARPASCCSASRCAAAAAASAGWTLSTAKRWAAI